MHNSRDNNLVYIAMDETTTTELVNNSDYQGEKDSMVCEQDESASSKRAMMLMKPLSSARKTSSKDATTEESNEEDLYENAKVDPETCQNLVVSKENIVTVGRVNEDPRVKNGKKVLVKAKGQGRNTESFDPKSTLVRPDMRILVSSKSGLGSRLLRHDDVLMVPNFFCEEDDWTIYNQLVREMRECQSQGLAQSEWISWHEGAHLISKNPTGSPTFQKIVKAMREYYHINNDSAGTRFNWYNDADDWKPFHHDSAAFNPQRAKQQNITVGVSFGATRELAFLHAKSNTKIYFPQVNGALFSFGRDGMWVCENIDMICTLFS